MALKAMLSKAEYDKLPDVLKAEYNEEGGDYVLDVDEKEYKGKLNEFRTNNVDLKRRHEEATRKAEKYKDVDPDKYAKALEALEKIEAMEEGELLKKGDVEAVVNKRLEAARKEHEAKLNAANGEKEKIGKEAATLRTKLGRITIHTQALSTLGKIAAVRQGAADDIIGRAERVWRIDEHGDVVAVDDKGEPAFGKDGALTFEEWGQKLVQEAPHLFEGSKGGGAEGGEKEKARPGAKTVKRSDKKAFSDNLMGIADGSVVVVD
jgi:hypothetical protein